MIKKITKFISLLLITVIVLLLITIFFTQTFIFRDWLKNYLISYINDNINASLIIDKIDGNLFRQVEIINATLKVQDDTLLFIPYIFVEYSLIEILQGKIQINNLQIVDPEIRLTQKSDNIWNFNMVLKSDSTVQKDTIISSSFNYLIFAENIQLKDGALKISSNGSNFNPNVEKINIQFTGFYSADSQYVHLQYFNFQSNQPDFLLKNLSFYINNNPDGIRVRNFSLQTQQNLVKVEGDYRHSPEIVSSINLKSEPVEWNEFNFVLPDLNITAKPTVDLETFIRKDSLICKLNIQTNQSVIHINSKLSHIDISDYSRFLEKIHYSMNGQVINLNVKEWISNIPADLTLNGSFEISGKNLTKRGVEGIINVDLRECILNKHNVDKLDLDSQFKNGNLYTQLTMVTKEGQLFIKTNVEDLFDELNYNLLAKINHLNLATLVNDTTFISDINFTVSANGNGLIDSTRIGKIDLSLSQSHVLNLNIDSINAIINLAGKNLLIDSCYLSSPYVDLKTEGRMNFQKKYDITFNSIIKNLEALRSYIGADSIQACGFLNGRIKGDSTAFELTTKTVLNNIVYNNNTIDSLSGSIRVTSLENCLSGSGVLLLRDIGFPEILINELKIETEFLNNEIKYKINANRDNFWNTQIQAFTILDSIIKTHIDNFNVNVRGMEWINVKKDMQITIDNSKYRFDNFHLKRNINNSNLPAIIKIDGQLSLEEEANLVLNIGGIELDPLSQVLNFSPILGGQLSLNLNFTGSVKNPVFSGNVFILNGKVDEYKYHSLKGNFDYKENKLDLNFSIHPLSTDSLTLSGYIPLHISFTDTKKMINLDEEFFARVKTNNFPFGILLTTINGIDNIQGYINCDLQIKNSLRNPQPHGYFNIINGAFLISKYGVDYRNMELAIVAKPEKVLLKKFWVERNGGFISASGVIDLNEKLYSGLLKTFQFDFKVKDFFLVKHKDYEVLIDASTQLMGNEKEKEFDGRITVKRSSIYLPAIFEGMELESSGNNIKIPLLVRATETDQMAKDTARTIKFKRGIEKSDFIRQLNGKLKLSIPKNTWLRHPNARFEIEGDLELIKNDKIIELFGTIEIIRGHYDLFGRRFQIKEGRLIFSGGENINPVILLEAEYRFRTTNKEQKTLQLNLGGNIKQPTINFLLDGRDISQADAVSYTIFGKSMDELTYGQHSDLVGGATDGTYVMDIAASMVSTRLSKSLGRDLNLDQLEIKAKDNWQAATFVVGKYITNDLFISYQREFGAINNDDIAPETVTIEYELTKAIFLQLIEGNSKERGADIIIKLDR